MCKPVGVVLASPGAEEQTRFINSLDAKIFMTNRKTDSRAGRCVGTERVNEVNKRPVGSQQQQQQQLRQWRLDAGRFAQRRREFSGKGAERERALIIIEFNAIIR